MKKKYAVGIVKVLVSTKEVFNGELVQHIAENVETMYGLTTEDVMEGPKPTKKKWNLSSSDAGHEKPHSAFSVIRDFLLSI